MRTPSKVLRHSKTVRWTHWLIALSGMLLLFSGFGELPMYERYMVTRIPGLGWSNDYDIQLTIHYLGAVVFTAATFFHMLYHLRRREFAIWPKRGDLAESLDIIKAMLSGKKEPPHGKFLAEQRLAYLAIGGVSLVLILTGLIKTYKNTGPVVLDPTFLGLVTFTHTMATFAFLLLFLAHLAAFLIKANRPLLWSMFSGYVDREYAEERHPLWRN